MLILLCFLTEIPIPFVSLWKFQYRCVPLQRHQYRCVPLQRFQYHLFPYENSNTICSPTKSPPRSTYSNAQSPQALLTCSELPVSIFTSPKRAAWTPVIMFAFKPAAKGRGNQGTSLSLRTLSKNCMHYFDLYAIGQKLVIWLYLAAEESRKRSPRKTFLFYYKEEGKDEYWAITSNFYHSI